MVADLPIAERVELSRPRWVRAGAPGGFSIGVALLGVFSFAIASLLPLDAPWLQLFSCPFRAATGLPCLGCGGTHAFVHLAHGEVLAAIAANPLWALAATILWIATIFSLLRFLGLRWTLGLPSFSPLQLRRARFALAALVAANWAFMALRTL